MAGGTCLGVTMALLCVPSLRRRVPVNYLLLSAFTLAEGYMLGAVAVSNDAEAVLIAAGATAIAFFGLSVFAFQTKYDVTGCGGVMVVLLLILLVAGFAMIFLPYNRVVMIVYGAVGSVVFSVYIVYDTQLMMGGAHAFAVHPDDYILAVINLYLDIINLFLYLLMIIRNAQRG